MVDAASLAQGLAVFKSGMDGLRSAFQFAKDIRTSLPSDRSDEVGQALEDRKSNLRLPRR